MDTLRKYSLWTSAFLFSVVAAVGLIYAVRSRGRLPAMLTDHLEQANELTARGRDREALVLYEQNVRALPWDTLGWLSLATSQQKLGKYEEAYTSWGEAIRRGTAEKAHAYFQRGICALEVGRNHATLRPSWYQRSFEAFTSSQQYGAQLPSIILQFMQGSATGWNESKEVH